MKSDVEDASGASAVTEKDKPVNAWSPGSSMKDASRNEVFKSSVILENNNISYEEMASRHGVNRTWLQIKQDLWIVLPICLLYLLAFLDRVNISNANAYGMGKDIHLVGNQYNVALAVFFVPYIVFEVPANWLLKKFTPHVFLSICLICFGGVSIGQGFVRNYHELIVTRVLLGALETAMFPSCFYLLGSWYTRAEAQKRYSFFFCSTSLAGAFGGLIAYGCNRFDMYHGIHGWQWIFILEGAITAFCGLCLFFLIADFPEQAKFLKPNELAYITEKLAIDQGASHFDRKIGVMDILRVFKDWKVMIVALMYFGQIIGAYGYAYFSVSIIKTFGLSPVQVQANKHIRYAACFLVASGLYTGMPLIICWVNMNFSGHVRKMTVSAFQVGFGNIGGIISPFVYRNQDAPGYRLGLWVSLAGLLFSLGNCVVYVLGLIKINRDRSRNRGQDKWLVEDEELEGDLRPSFKYMY
nr:ST.6 [Starmerella bombicola]